MSAPDVLAPGPARALRRRGLRWAVAVGAGLGLAIAGGVHLAGDQRWLVHAPLACVLAAIATYGLLTWRAAWTAWAAAREAAHSGTLSTIQLQKAVHLDLVDVLDEPEAVRAVTWAEATWTRTMLLAPTVSAVNVSVALGLLAPVVSGEESWSPWSVAGAALLLVGGVVAWRGGRRTEAFLRDRGSLPEAAG